MPLHRLLPLAALLALAGCTCADTVSGARFACADAADCLDGFVCRGGECRPDVVPEGACFPGETKACAGACASACSTDGGWLACAPTSGPGFEIDPSNCGECARQCSTRLAFTCVGARCTCSRASDCPAGQLCGAGGLCVLDSDPCAAVACDAGTVCRNGTCARTGCDRCARGEVCDEVTQICRPIDPCHFAVACDGGVCEGGAKPDGEACDDGEACSFADVCTGGVCRGVGFSCPAAGQCEQAVTCDGDGGCGVVAKADGTTCDDGDACTHTDQCVRGACVGASYTCATGTCDAVTTCLGDGGCAATPRDAGAACDDGQPCTFGETCDSAGQCVGTSYTCPAPTQCQQTVACAGDGGCVVMPRVDGTQCDDGVPCTQADVCTAGACRGTPKTTFEDDDGDGLGGPVTAMVCPAPAGFVADGGDCNDNSAFVKTLQPSARDVDRDGYTQTTTLDPAACVGATSTVNGRTYFRDSSGNYTWLATASATADCLDSDAGVYVTRAMVVNDADHDGYATATGGSACVGGSMVFNGRTYYSNGSAFVYLDAAAALGTSDCNDAVAAVFTNRSVARDADNDSFTTSTTTATQCTGASSTVNGRTYYADSTGAASWLGTASSAVDCDDASAAVTVTSYYADADGDGFGAGTATLACSAPPSTVTNNTDCNAASANEYRLVSVALDVDQDGFATSAPASTCVGASTTQNGRTYYRTVSSAYQWLLGTQALGTSDCNPSNGAVSASVNNVLQDNDRDGYPFPDDVAQNITCAGPATVSNGRTYYANGSGGWWLARADCINRSGNTCPDLDCYDANSNARPGQTTYFTSHRGDGSFDYDCSTGGAVTASASGTFCASVQSGVPTFTDATCGTTAGTVNVCVTPTPAALPASCGKTLAGASSVFITSGTCVSATVAGTTVVGCR